MILSQEELLSRYVEPHSLVSREVKNEDIQRLIEESEICLKLCTIPRGRHVAAFAIAHPQIDNNDPLRFFVLNSGIVVINPIILRHVNTISIKQEGCMSFPANEDKYVTRFTKLTMQFDVVNKEEMRIVGTDTKEFKGTDARVIQHEIDHLDGKYIYPLNEGIVSIN